MKMKEFIKKSIFNISAYEICLILFFSFLSLVFFACLFNYKGSSFLYILFSFSYFLMLYIGIRGQAGYGYLYLSAFLVLGVWLKFSFHQILDYSFVEAIGNFKQMPHNWDEVMIIAIFGNLGIMSARLIFSLLKGKSKFISDKKTSAPDWYVGIAVPLWMLFFLVLIICAVSNYFYNFQQSGLVPTTILMWPMNAVIYWLLGKGFILVLLTLLWWHFLSKNSYLIAMYAILLEATISSLSILSRGIFLFHSAPSIFSIYNYNLKNKKIGHLSFAIFIFVFVILLLFVFFYSELQKKY